MSKTRTERISPQLQGYRASMSREVCRSGGSLDRRGDLRRSAATIEGVLAWSEADLEIFQVNDIMDELDLIRRQQRKANESTRSRLRVKRVMLNRVSQDPPVVAVYPFMLDAAWLARYEVEHPDDELIARDQEVAGFGSAQRVTNEVDEDGAIGSEA